MTANAVELRDRLQDALGADYQINREVGGGGMSRVFAVHDQKLNRDIVAKVLPPELSGEVNLERFKREIIFAASLQHPHIVPVHAAGDVDGLPYYTMPFVEGESLRHRITRVQRMPVNDALRILRDIARALSYAHRRGVVHRDIKPENVLITDNVAVVTDFGIAKAVADSREDPRDGAAPASSQAGGLTLTGTFIGTPAYMAPEQAVGNPRADHRTDLYALGVVGYELLTGAAPFSERSDRERLAAQLTERPVDLSHLRLDVPPAVSEFVMRCLEKEPENRPQTADELLEAIEAALAGPTLPVADDEPAHIRRAYGLYAVALLAATSIAWFAMNAIGLPDWVLPGTVLIMAAGFFVVTFTAVGRYAAFKLLNAASGGVKGDKPWQQTTGSRSLWIAEHVSWKRVAAGGSIALGSFGVLVAGFMLSRNAGIGPFASLLGKGTLQAQERVLFTNMDVTGVDSTLSSAISVAARTALLQSRAIRLLTPEQVEGALERMRRPRNTRVDLTLGREMATREGVRALVAGFVVPAGNQFAVSLRLVSADSGRDLAEAHRNASGLEDIVATIDAVSRDLRGKIGESLRSVRETPPLPSATTSSLKALRLFAAHFEAPTREAQVQLLREAIAEDSQFASAYRRLYILRGGGNPEGEAAIRKAVQLVDKLPERERLQVEAYHYMLAAFFPDADRGRAINILEQLAADGDEMAIINLPEFLINRRDFARAESLSRVNIAKMPQAPNSYETLVHVLVEQGKLDEAERTTDDALRKFPAHQTLIWWKQRMPLYRGRYDEFERTLDSLRFVQDVAQRNQARNVKIQLLGMQGRFRERERLRAERRAEQIAQNINPVNALNAATDSLWDVIDSKRPDTAAAVARLAKVFFEQRRNFVGMRSWGAAIAFRSAGRADLTRAVLDSFTRYAGSSGQARQGTPMFTHKLRAEIAAAEGRHRDAIEEVKLGDLMPDGRFHACEVCYFRDLSEAFDRAGETDSAIVWYERAVHTTSSFTVDAQLALMPSYFRRLGELYEQKGDRRRARERYERFVEIRKNADPEFQPEVAEIRSRIARLRS